MSPVEVHRVDVAELDLELAGRLAAIDNAGLDGVPLRHHTAETFLLEWLRAARDDVVSVDTWNALDKAPMIAINDALGCRVVAETVKFVKQR